MSFECTVLEPETRSLLRKLGTLLSASEFYLAGGTALAIQLGHRRSIDLDFFKREPFDPDDILEMLSIASLGPISVDSRAAHTLNLRVADVKVDLIRYAYPLLCPLVTRDEYQMLAVPDIAAMKLAAITNRGSKKDFVDLYYLLKVHEIEELIDFYRRKYRDHDPFFVIRSLAYFDDADREPDPIMLKEAPWPEIKNRILIALKAVA